MRGVAAAVLITLVSTLSGIAGSSAAHARDCGHDLVYAVDDSGAQTGLTKVDLGNLSRGNDKQTGKANQPSYQYTSTYACPFSLPGGDNAMCVGAGQACVGNTLEEGQGPLTRLYRRAVDATGTPLGGWQLVGTTCLPEAVPGQPVRGLAQIRTAFRNTPFAKPGVHIQPEGNLTLVTLPTYFEVTWPSTGFQPGETNTVTLLGHQVRIRPTLQSYTYQFGDGTGLGPTTSPGGPYPTGDITHAYPKPGTYPTRVDATYGGQFSINGGDWITIPDTATITGPPQTLTVKTARNRLVLR